MKRDQTRPNLGGDMFMPPAMTPAQDNVNIHPREVIYIVSNDLVKVNHPRPSS